MFLIEKDGRKDIDESIIALIENGNNNELVAMLQNANLKDIVASSGMTLLHLSTMYDNHFMTEFLIERGADINAQNKEGNTPLMIAATEMMYDQAKLLLDANADFKIKNCRSESAVTISIDLWHTQGPCQGIIELIFDKLKMNHTTIEEMAETLMSAGCDLSDVLYFKYPDSVQIMKTLLQKEYYHINYQNSRSGDTVLHVAVALNIKDSIEELLLLGSDITIENKHTHIPIAWYILLNEKNQNQETIKMLIPKEYDWMQLFTYGVSKRLKIRSVFLRGSKETLKIFKECCNIDMKAKDGVGETPLHYLIGNFNDGVLELFEDTEFDINASDYRFKRTAIHSAAANGDLDKMNFLLARGAELDHCDIFGNTALMSAVSDGDIRHFKKESVQLLILHGANAQIANARYQSTVISIASEYQTYYQVDPVLAHLALCEVTGGEITTTIRDHINSDNEIKTRYDSYKQQLDGSKTDYIWRSVSVYDSLTGSEEKLAMWAKWHEFVDRFAKREFNLNSYFVALLQKRFAKAIEICEMRRKVAPILKESLKEFDLDHVIINEIVSYLDYKNLQKIFE